jgi:Zn-dependent peptidase ImmA (M78 family)
LALICRVLDRSPEYFIPINGDRPEQPALAVTLRAQLERVPHQALAQTIGDFLDYVEAAEPAEITVPDLSDLKPEAAATRALKECSIKAPPVKPEKIAQHFHLPVLEWRFPDALSALIVRTVGNGYAIGVNRTHPRARQRFSVAHELGHALLRHDATHYLEFTDQSAIGEPPDYNYRDEREANAFAASLLMSKKWLHADAQRDPNVSKLARRYQVSEEAMSFRLINLGLV